MHNQLSPASFLRLMHPVVPAAPIIDAESPRDCVLAFPSVSPDHTVLIGFDREGRARIRVELETEDVTAAWERWLLRYVRRKYDRTLRLVK